MGLPARRTMEETVTQLTQEATNLRAVLEALEQARRALCYLGVPIAHHRERLNQVTRELCGEFPALAAEIDEWEAEQHEGVEF